MSNEMAVVPEPGKKFEKTLTNVALFACNFQGKNKPYTVAGMRNFGVFISEDTAKEMTAEGWSVKHFRNDHGVLIPFLIIHLFGGSYSEQSKITLNGEPCSPLIDDHMKKLDEYGKAVKGTVHIYGYQWAVTNRAVTTNGPTRSGVKNYLLDMDVKTSTNLSKGHNRD